MKEMHQGYMDFADVVGQYKDQHWLQAIVDYAQKKWTKRNMRDDQLMAYEVKQQVEGKLDYDYERMQPNWDEKKYDNCQHDFDAIDLHNAMFCYKQDD